MRGASFSACLRDGEGSHTVTTSGIPFSNRGSMHVTGMHKFILDIDFMKTIYIPLLLFVSGVSQAADWTYASWLAEDAYMQVINESICTFKLTAIDPNADSAFMCSRGGDTAIEGLDKYDPCSNGHPRQIACGGGEYSDF